MDWATAERYIRSTFYGIDHVRGTVPSLWHLQLCPSLSLPPLRLSISLSLCLSVSVSVWLSLGFYFWLPPFSQANVSVTLKT